MSKLKNFFSTPKKAVISSACIVATVALIGSGAVFAAQSVEEHNSIGRVTAEQFTLSDAGVDSSTALVSRTEFERENGQYVYEVEFAANGVEYDYTVNAANGAIIKRDTDGQTLISQVSAQQLSVQQQEQISEIGMDNAKIKALDDAQVSSSDVTYTKAQLDYDNGIKVYDIEFYTAYAEYEYEINIETGAIVDKSIEVFQTVQPQTAQPSIQGTYIGVDSAKDIAVSHAEMSLNNVIFQKAKLENDDGRVEYEIEFISNGMEYEYTIDAISGSILECDYEYDD